MKTKKNFLIFLFLITTTVLSAQLPHSGSFTLGGNANTFYPVSFEDGGWWQDEATILNIGRSYTHVDASWHGSLIAAFRYHVSHYGNDSHFIDADIKQYRTVVGITAFIAGWQDATIENSTSNIVIWLRGATTYHYYSNYPQSPTFTNGPLTVGSKTFSTKTQVDSYVNSYGPTFSKDILANGNIKIPKNSYFLAGDENDKHIKLFSDGSDGYISYSNCLYFQNSGTIKGTITSDGKFGIGTKTPTGKLHVVDNNKNYYVNRIVADSTDDNININYLILHKMYNGAALQDHYVMGKIVAERGSSSAWNRKWTIEVNTASANNTTRGSIISYNESSKLVTLQYAGEEYLAAIVDKTSSIYNFSFTGYARNEMLRLVKATEVSNVQDFNDKDNVNINGALFAGNNVGIGTSNPKTKLEVGAGLGLSVTTSNLDPNQGYDLSFLKNTGRLLLGWNRSGGGGEQNLISNRAGGSTGGFAFYDYSNTGVMTHIMTLTGAGNVGIGIMDPGVKLDVAGTVRAHEVKVCLNKGCDYVFENDYQLMNLNDLNSFVTTNKHLPEVAPAAQMESEGVNLSEMNALLLKKIEELTLYLIELNKKIEILEAR